MDAPGTSSGKLEKDHFRTGLESREHRSHRLPREDWEPFQCRMLLGTVSLVCRPLEGPVTHQAHGWVG